MLTIQLLSALNDNYIYLLHEATSGETAVIDPAEAQPVIDALEQQGWHLDYVFNTHHHGDHVGANLALKQRTQCKIVGAARDQKRIPGIDITVEEGDIVYLGNQGLRVMDTPGHTLGHIVYYCETSRALFCGDTLFSLGCGRLFEGSAMQLWQSLQRFKALPSDTRVYCAHEYTAANGRFALSVERDNPALQQRLSEVSRLRAANQPTLPSTLELELATNPFLREESLEIRAHLGLSPTADSSDVFARLRALKDHFV